MMKEVILFFVLSLFFVLGYGQSAYQKLVEKNYTEISSYEYKLKRKNIPCKHGRLISYLRLDKNKKNIRG